MARRIVLHEDLELYPNLPLHVGEEYDFPDPQPLNETNDEGQEGDEGDESGDPPPGGNNPDKKPIIP